jgi:non-canonical poly(A) RNA polymerase PAPD5/7
LSSEIAKFHIYATPSRPEGLARKHAVEQIQSHVRELVPNFILEVFGSERTGLSLATSDIDLRLVTPEIAVDTQGSLRPPPRQQRLELVDKLYKLRNHLQRKNQYFLCAIRYSRYPLLSFQDRASGLDVQIVLSNDTSSARAAVSKYLKEYSYLAEVYTVVKSMFDIRGLSDVFRGGFGGYSIFMMVVASLQLNAPIKADAAHGLLSFLQFWSTFDTTQKGISVEPSELFDKDETVVMGGRAKSLLEVCSLL